jgi:hypothetical protein
MDTVAIAGLLMAAFLSPLAFADAATRPADELASLRLPDPLVARDGHKITSAKDWRDRRRPEILELFRAQMYGRSPGRPKGMTFKAFDTDRQVFGGKATRKQVTINFLGREDGPKMDLLMYLPNAAKRPVPVILMLNFKGNQAVIADPGIRMPMVYTFPKGKPPVCARATEESRGEDHLRYPIEEIISAGYGFATAYYCEIDPDYDDNFQNGIHAALDHYPKGERPADAWGSIATWAWGLSRAMDYLETDRDVDKNAVVLLGHSRLGKTALWAGAQDERFAIVISNGSGCGGAALSREKKGETVKQINDRFPHWFCGNFKKYNEREAELPVDQHMLIALVAPRPVYVASADKDIWADPRSEFLAALGADPVYRLLGTDGLAISTISTMPELEKPVTSTIGHHIRPGGHDLTVYDWRCYLAFADKHLGRGGTAKP